MRSGVCYASGPQNTQEWQRMKWRLPACKVRPGRELAGAGLYWLRRQAGGGRPAAAALGAGAGLGPSLWNSCCRCAPYGWGVLMAMKPLRVPLLRCTGLSARTHGLGAHRSPAQRVGPLATGARRKRGSACFCSGVGRTQFWLLWGRRHRRSLPPSQQQALLAVTGPLSLDCWRRSHSSHSSVG